MNNVYFDRPLGVVDPQLVQRHETGRRVNAIALASHIRFDSSNHANEQRYAESERKSKSKSDRQQVWAHKSGVQCMTIEKQSGRYALSGGADASVHLWDLDAAEAAQITEVTGTDNDAVVHRPLDTITRGSESHKYGITCLSFYPSDPGLFISSSYDHHVNVYDTNTLEVSASFDLASKVYSHDLSPIASNPVVAAASQHSSVRLIDLRSGSTLHALVGHVGAILTTAWSPREEFVLASGGADGTLRLWDIRKSASCLGMFDLEDSTGAFGVDGMGSPVRDKFTGRAHVGGCNGLTWTEDGQNIVSTGFDERIRLWNVALGSNELSHFGPQIRNRNISTVLPLTISTRQTMPGHRSMFYPNDREILMFDMLEGTLLKRLKPPGAAVAQGKKSGGQRNVVSRVTSLAWRAESLELYSTHSDGSIRAWTPATTHVSEDEIEDLEQKDAEDETRKRKALEEIFQSFTKKQVTFR